MCTFRLKPSKACQAATEERATESCFENKQSRGGCFFAHGVALLTPKPVDGRLADKPTPKQSGAQRRTKTLFHVCKLGLCIVRCMV
jgi:hypothetical protein